MHTALKVIKGMGLACLAAALALNALATPEVTGVSARQRWPWNNLVDVTFTVSGSDSAETFYRVDVSAVYPGVAGDRLPAQTLLDEPLVKGDGTYRFVWDMGADAHGLVTSNLTVQVTVAPFVETEPVYMVVDLSGGPEATSYPVRYTFDAPDLSDDTCRTTELWLRRCPAGIFQMGFTSGDSSDSVPSHFVRLTKPFYIAVFETTQQQWYQVMGTWPSYFANAECRATRPVEKVTLDQMRGNSGPNWYATPVSQVAAASFMGRLRARAGTALATADLPTEAQWEIPTRRRERLRSAPIQPTHGGFTTWSGTCWNGAATATRTQARQPGKIKALFRTSRRLAPWSIREQRFPVVPTATIGAPG